MDKIVEGVVFKKARFLRTTCKNCGKNLSLLLVKQEKKFCDKKCNRKFQRKFQRKHNSPDISITREHETIEWDHGDNGIL